MAIEISLLIGLEKTIDTVKTAAIGNGVCIEEIETNGWKQNIFEQVKQDSEDDYRRLITREELEWFPYSHRIFIKLDTVTALEAPIVNQAKQYLMRTIVLSKIIHPTPIALHSTRIIRIDYDGPPNREFFVDIFARFFGTAYVVRQERPITITTQQVAEMAKHWSAFMHFYDNAKAYQRIIRALMFFNEAYHVEPAHLVHTIFHSALESLVCTSHRKNRVQVTKRLPQVLPSITEQQAIDIYEFCVDVKHTAAPGLLHSSSVTRLDPQDQIRYDASLLLETALRNLFLKALEDRNFADELADKTVLEAKYPI